MRSSFVGSCFDTILVVCRLLKLWGVVWRFGKCPVQMRLMHWVGNDRIDDWGANVS